MIRAEMEEVIEPGLNNPDRSVRVVWANMPPHTRGIYSLVQTLTGGGTVSLVGFKEDGAR